MVDKESLFIFLLDNSNNIKSEIIIKKPPNYSYLLSILGNSIKELPEYFYLFYNNEKNEEIKIYNDEQYKLCKDILLIREIKNDQMQPSIFSLNYNILSESKKEILDEKYGFNICNIIIKNENPLFCYRCQKIFHQKCLLDWDKKKKLLNQELSCPNCNKKLPIEHWEKKLDFEDERIHEARLMDKIINNDLNKKINDKINKIKYKQFEEFKKANNHIYKRYNDLINISNIFLKNFKKILAKINEINSLINKSININLESLSNNISLENIDVLYKSIINQLNIIKTEINNLKNNNKGNESNKKIDNKNIEKEEEQNKNINEEIKLKFITDSGKQYDLTTKSSSLIYNIKVYLKTKNGIPFQIELLFKNTLMKDMEKIKNYGIIDNSIIKIEPIDNNIIIKYHENKEQKILMHLKKSVEDLKTEITNEINFHLFPKEEQRLFYKGKELDDNKKPIINYINERDIKLKNVDLIYILDQKWYSY